MATDLYGLHSQLQDPVCVALSAADVSTLVNALYPPRRAPSLSERDSSHSGLQSSASSLSGFSLFQKPGAIDHMLNKSNTSAAINGASHIDEEHGAKTDSADEVSLDLDAAKVRTELDGQRLREICVAIEDSLTTRRPNASDQWCILLANPVAQDLRTVYEKLFGSPSRTRRATQSQHVPSNHKICRGVIEELLKEGELSQSRDCFGGPDQQAHALLHQITSVLNQRVKRLKDNADFATAHCYFRKIRHLNDLCNTEGHPLELITLLRGLDADKQESLSTTSSIIDSCDTLTRSLTPVCERQSSQLVKVRDTMGQLRDKMWYVADVRTSATYDEIRSVVAALKAMGKAQQSARTQFASPSWNWNGAKSSSTPYQAKTNAQVLDLLSAPQDYGGRSKLNDDHSKALATWMERHTIENFCRGEERLHKTCMEIRKAVDQLTAENSSLRSSTLFARDEPRTAVTQTTRQRNSLWTLHEDRKRFDLLTLHTDVRPGLDNLSNGSSHPLSARSSRDRLDSWSPSITNKSSVTFWSPVTTEARSPSSVTSIGSSQTQGAPSASINKHMQTSIEEHRNSVEHLRQHTISLFLSDLGTPLFGDGSETDRAFWSGLGGELTARYLRNLFSEEYAGESEEELQLCFDFSEAFEELVLRFSASCDPYQKLKRLLDIDTLLAPYMAGLASSANSHTDFSSRTVPQSGINQRPSSAAVDIKVQGFTRLFCAEATRPNAIFRDLQYIAALVPSAILETTPQGKAFWNAAAAISNLKRGACNIMVETADSIIAHHSNNRGHGRSSSVAQQERDSAAFSVPKPTPSPEDITGRTMSDAALLLQITAREGYPVAQRELATLYLTDPELMEHIIAPFSRPREVFKEELESKWRKNQDPARCDPTTMCVAHHWMSLSSKGGDALATEFLRQREEMERLP